MLVYGNTMSLARRTNMAVVKGGGAEVLPSADVRDIAVYKAYLDALPIPAALLRTTSDLPDIVCGNAVFEALAHDLALPQHEASWDLFAKSDLRDALDAFWASSETMSRFEWFDGSEVGRRHYTVSFSRTADWLDSGELILVTLIDRTAAVEADRSLRAEMLRDSLTGLPNRTAFIEAVDAAIEAANHSCAVLIVDLTRFSRVNESMGSLAGDELIITVARRLVSALRVGDVLARLGGDEFGILLRLQEGEDDALQAARRIHASLLTPFKLSDLEIRIDCAIGCSLMTEAITMSEDLVRNAQVALKRAKQSGRVEVYQQGEVAVARRRFSMETELRRAIEGGQLKLAYQPLIDLQGDRLAGFEALARWSHPDYGAISPTDFISVAEESGLIVPLGRWAINEAMATLAKWDETFGGVLPIYVGVNVSAVQLVRDDIAEVARGALETYKLQGSRLMLELTESAIIADPERSGRLLNRLKELDTTIAMDDFGTGYSSLAYLQKLPIDLLKIDRSFVSGMLGDRDSVAIVRAILSLASALGMHTTAEGVETAELAQTLAALGCSYGQGYYYSRPLSAEAAYAYCKRFNSVKPAE
jgi:diguanylate cyclase (GGDEF)-like protein